MTNSNPHFFVRTRKDALPSNPGAHPLVAVRLLPAGSELVAIVAACSPSDNPCRKTAREVLISKRVAGNSVTVDRTRDTLAAVLRRARVPAAVLATLDMERAENAFERALDAPT